MSILLPSRRAIIGGLAAGLVAAPAILRGQQLFTAYPFRLGVAAGEPAADGFVIWTRLVPEPLERHGGMPMAPVEVEWQVAGDAKFQTIAAKGTALARPELGHAVHVELTGLQPDRPYWYRFLVGRERSTTGRARTLPLPGAALARIRFGVAGCQNYEDGLYTAYRHLADEDLAFVYHYGDYIYEGRGTPQGREQGGATAPFLRMHEGQEIYDLDDYRRRYAQYKLDPDLQAAHASAAWFATFDDHEVDNNWTGSIDQDDTPPEIFALRRATAFQAYYEHLPFRRASFPGPGGMHVHRRARIGTLLDLHLLDTRQFRTDQPCGDGLQTVCAGVLDQKAQVLGQTQEAWLARGLAEKRARWNALAQQVMVMPLDRRTGDEPAPIRNMDSWGGYDAPRERFLAQLSAAGNAVVLTGDEHQNFAGELRRAGGRGEAVAVEFVATSISSGGDGADRRAGTDRIMAGNPFLRFENDRRGYLVCDVTPERWQTDVRTVAAVSRPDAPVATAASIAVPHGTTELHIG
ncbi:alkaline phosphatase [Sphingomonas metalli]|uniref:Alkaline phosphatase n=1 Tax=Sphingomonas metalli TaxID=1779358 RepID=A0A916T2G7_9SPHN|nr:alkaline phosphatase D family protein [Sphingomonas metalli]GGB28161.1 alkaline phosphatase [Sphingomonas metalli]